MRSPFIIISIFCLGITACQNTTIPKAAEKEAAQDSIADIPFTVARHYFVKNYIKGAFQMRIDNALTFDSVFGMAAVMGKDGLPTEIDFEKQSVIALVEEESDSTKEILPLSFIRNKEGRPELTYQIETREKAGFITKPGCILIFDKSYAGEVEFKPVK